MGVSTSIRHWVVTTFIGAVLLLAFVGAVAYRTTARLVATNQRVMRAHSLVERLTFLRLLLDDAESASRGYALTGRKEYLEPYNAAVAQLDSTIQILRHDLADSADLLRGFEELPALIEARLAVTRELITAREQQGFESAIKVVTSGRGKDVTDRVWAKITSLQVQEQNLLLERDREARESARQAIWAVLVVSSLGVLVLAAATTVISRTIRQREVAEATLRRSDEMQRAILDGTNHAIISTDAVGRIRTMNATGLLWLGYEINELRGRSLLALHRDDEISARAEELSRSMGATISGFEALSVKSGRGVAEERNWNYRRKDGSVMPVRVSMTALRDNAGAVSGFVAIVSDMRERRAVERMKDEFISVVSHELRTPLTSIRGALGLLAGGALQNAPDRAQRMIQIASENTDRLMRLVNDILDLERIESGNLVLNRSNVNSADLMRQATDSVRVLAESAGVTVNVTLANHWLEVDGGRIVQGFTNLLANAVKFSPSGGVVEFTAEMAGANVLFKVADHGRGIPAEKLESIFERFQQVDASDAREKAGTGLGLTITRSIVQQHDGDVWAESELGRGSTFFIRLPLAKSSYEESDACTSAS